MNIDPRLRVQSQHAAKSITCPGMHGSSFYINLAASTAAKNVVSARHPRGPSVGAERRSRAPRVRASAGAGPRGCPDRLYLGQANRECHFDSHDTCVFAASKAGFDEHLMRWALHIS